MSYVLDTGAFVAVERGDETLSRLIKAERLAGRTPLTHGGVVGQVWRGGHGTQAKLARVMKLVNVVPLDAALGREAGELLARSGTRDVIDAAVVLISRSGDRVFTSDPDDLVELAVAARRRLEIIPV